VNALKINPDLKLDPTVATPELEEAFESARKQAGVRKAAPQPQKTTPPPQPKAAPPQPPPQPKAAPPQPPPQPPKKEEPKPKKHEAPPPPPPPPHKKEEPPQPEPPSPAEVKGLQHNPVDEARPNKSIVVKALLGSDSGATRLFLFFRSSGQEDYLSLQMKHT